MGAKREASGNSVSENSYLLTFIQFKCPCRNFPKHNPIGLKESLCRPFLLFLEICTVNQKNFDNNNNGKSGYPATSSATAAGWGAAAAAAAVVVGDFVEPFCCNAYLKSMNTLIKNQTYCCCCSRSRFFRIEKDCEF